MDKQLYFSYLASPIGQLLFTAEGPFLTGLYMEGPKGLPSPPAGAIESDAMLADARQQLAEYFAGRRQTFDLALRMEGTPFQRRVWQELVRIPYGTTITYAQLAARIGQPTAARAVGLANGRNPIGIVVPCHRVIGADGTLVGYGGGLENKRFLLELERRVSAAQYEPSSICQAANGDDHSAASSVKRVPTMAAKSGRS
jgi:methylated-DNA-[protein]-cysteine S-methyltransferase